MFSFYNDAEWLSESETTPEIDARGDRSSPSLYLTFFGPHRRARGGRWPPISCDAVSLMAAEVLAKMGRQEELEFDDLGASKSNFDAAPVYVLRGSKRKVLRRLRYEVHLKRRRRIASTEVCE